jgi:hypothetical protein
MKLWTATLAAALAAGIGVAPRPAISVGDPPAGLNVVAATLLDHAAANQGRLKVFGGLVSAPALTMVIPAGALVLGTVVMTPTVPASPDAAVEYQVYLLDRRGPDALIEAFRVWSRGRGYKPCGGEPYKMAENTVYADYCTRESQVIARAMRHGGGSLGIFGERRFTRALHDRRVADPTPTYSAAAQRGGLRALTAILENERAAAAGRVSVSTEIMAPPFLRLMVLSGARVLGSIVTRPETPSSPTATVGYDVYFLDARRPRAVLEAIRGRMQSRGFKPCSVDRSPEYETAFADDYCMREGHAMAHVRAHGAGSLARVSESVYTRTLRGQSGLKTTR